MHRDKIQPSEELIKKVRFIADTKENLPFSSRGLLNINGVYYQVRSSLGGRLFYMAGGKFIPKLTFTVEPDGSVTVQKYESGEWETNVDAAEEMAWKLFEETTPSEDELLRQARERDEQERKRKEKLHHQIQVESISRYEKQVKKGTASAHSCWEAARCYEELGRFKDEETAIKKACELEPARSQYYEDLGRIYLAALSNTIRAKAIPAIWTNPSDITVKSLELATERVYSLAKENLDKAYSLAKGQNAAEFFLQKLREALDYLQELRASMRKV
jgi:tetratricopeptide (TPR) repeat protein